MNQINLPGHRVFAGMFFTVTLLWLASSAAGLFAQRQYGKPFIKNYTVKDYNGYHQNWAVIQDHTGFIYCANNNGVLVYDGMRWQIIMTHKKGTVRSLAADKNNRVYVGAQNEFGYIKKLPNGRMEFVSLDNLITDKAIKYDDVWRIHIEDDLVYFRTKQYIFCWDGKTITVIKPDKMINNSFDCEGKIYLYHTEAGLSVLRKQKITFLEGSEELAGKQVYTAIALSEDSLLLGTGTMGFYLYTNKKCKPFVTEVDAYVSEKKLYRGIKLTNNQIALGTLYGGLVIINNRGQFVTLIDLNAGLVSEKIHDIFLDHQESIWLALDNGIAHVSYPSPITYWNETSGIEGVVQQIVDYRGKTYASSNAGLFVLDLFKDSQRLPRYVFRKFKSLNTQVFDIVPVNNGFLCATKEGVEFADENSKKIISNKPAFVFIKTSFDSTIILAGKKDGLRILKITNAGVVDQGAIKGINTEVRSLFESPDSLLWVGTKYDGLWKFKWNTVDPTEPALTHYDTSHGLPPGYIIINEIDKEPVFITMSALFRFDAGKKTFYRDTLLLPAAEKALPDYKDFGMAPMHQVDDGRIWSVIENRTVGEFKKSDDLWRYDHFAFGIIPKHAMIIAMRFDRSGIMWLGGSEGIIKVDRGITKNDLASYRTVIRSVKTIADQILVPFDSGNGIYGESKISDPFPYEIKQSLNHIRIEYSALSFENEQDNEFSVLLEGYDQSWSAWSRERYKEYMNLPEGYYIFKVRSRNIFEVIGQEAVFNFRVLPPWYRTWWSYILYTAAGCLVLICVTRWRVYVYRKRNAELELKVQERTRDLTDTQRQLIQSEKSAALGQLVGGIAHEINNPLSVVDGNLFYLNDYMRNALKIIEEIESQLRNEESNSPDHRIRTIDKIKQKFEFTFMQKDLEKIFESSAHGSRRIKKIVDDLRNLSGTDEQELVMSDIHDCIEQAIHALSQIIPDGINIRTQKGNLPLIPCFPGLLTHAIRHIIHNSVQALNEKGIIIITTSLITCETGQQISERTSVKISITDNGCGIPENIQKNIFDPFFTTKTVGQGTGLGLSIAYQFIRRHDGQINFTSKVNEGTTFNITLPANI